jgi:hypothetical protein
MSPPASSTLRFITPSPSATNEAQQLARHPVEIGLAIPILNPPERAGRFRSADNLTVDRHAGFYALATTRMAYQMTWLVVVVVAQGKEIAHLLVETLLDARNLADTRQQFVKVIPATGVLGRSSSMTKRR